MAEMTAPPIELIDADTRGRMGAAVRLAVKLAQEENKDPQAALAQAARQMDLTPEGTARISEAWNVARTVDHLHSAADKTAAFSIVAPDEVVKLAFGTPLVSSGPRDQEVKQASTAIPHQESHVTFGGASTPLRGGVIRQMTLDMRENQQKAAAEAAARTAESQYGRGAFYAGGQQDTASITKARADFMAKAAALREYETAKRAAQCGAVRFLDKLAEAAQVIHSNLASLPYDRLMAGWAQGRDRNDAIQVDGVVRGAICENYGEKLAAPPLDVPAAVYGSAPSMKALDDLFNAALTQRELRGDLEKKAEGLSLLDPSELVEKLHGTLSGGADESKKPSPDVSEAMAETYDPKYENDLRIMRVQTNLGSLLSQDPVISKYPAPEVIEHFDNIADVSPSAVEHMELLRGLLRRSLQQGGLDPFEVGQLASTAKSLHEVSPHVPPLSRAAGNGRGA